MVPQGKYTVCPRKDSTKGIQPYISEERGTGAYHRKEAYSWRDTSLETRVENFNRVGRIEREVIWTLHDRREKREIDSLVWGTGPETGL